MSTLFNFVTYTAPKLFAPTPNNFIALSVTQGKTDKYIPQP